MATTGDPRLQTRLKTVLLNSGKRLPFCTKSYHCFHNFVAEYLTGKMSRSLTVDQICCHLLGNANNITINMVWAKTSGVDFQGMCSPLPSQENLYPSHQMGIDLAMKGSSECLCITCWCHVTSCPSTFIIIFIFCLKYCWYVRIWLEA